MHTADQCIFAIANTATEPEHTNQSIACNYEEEKFTKFHQTDTYFKIVILNKLELFVKFLFLKHVSFFFGIKLSITCVGSFIYLFILLISICFINWLLSHLDFFMICNFLATFMSHHGVVVVTWSLEDGVSEIIKLRILNWNLIYFPLDLLSGNSCRC